MDNKKQRWVYTEDGPELEKPAMDKLKVNKWFFITPWILMLALILYLFTVGGSATVWAIILVIVGPITVIFINGITFNYLVLKPIRKKAAKSSADKSTKIKDNN